MHLQVEKGPSFVTSFDKFIHYWIFRRTEARAENRDVFRLKVTKFHCLQTKWGLYSRFSALFYILGQCLVVE